MTLTKSDKQVIGILYTIVFLLFALALILEIACPECGDIVSLLKGLL